ncbi:PREDICTED: zinc finger protein 467-like [Cyphomyrmex costatus]|uniref:Zinc finger E-box-binding homeobox 1 n=1 Tax=Cyphomyrmex costatus TaxID=456900 RepID=A0A195CTK9_9HYME|nr:PREDICTED: zinc finger protein 467-like [Cyphomyrmex costatus]KYN03469.1 Zinc finger E-box-binding homeobox 1 [Cyphomyrmex costatus]
MFPCDTCNRQYRRIISLQRHKRLECGKEAKFECMMCHAKFKHKHSLLRHYNVHIFEGITHEQGEFRLIGKTTETHEEATKMR